MANESFADAPLVEVDGQPLPVRLAAQLVQVRVDGSLNLPDSCLLRFRDPARTVLGDAGIRIGSRIGVKVNSAEPGGPIEVSSGEVVAMELDLDKHGSISEVRALDPAHRLFRGRRVVAYPDMSLTEVVRQVCRRAGVEVGTIDPISGGGRAHTQISQDNQSDWDFLAQLAASVGAHVTASDGTLHFRLPAAPSGAPDASATAVTDALVLEEGRNLMALRACVSAIEQVPEVEVRGWDFEHKQALSATATPAATAADVAGLDPSGLGRGFAAPPFLAAGPTNGDPDLVQATATGLADQLGDASVELDGLARGNPRLRPGVAVTLAGVGRPFAGRYTLTTVRHLFGETAGYTTGFTVSGRRDRSVYGLTRGGTGRAGGDPAFAGLVPAVVTDARDPLDLGRVRLEFPWLAENFTSGWARTVHPGGGPDRGLLMLPEVGDEVLAGFAMGDLNCPFVLGGLHNGVDPPPSMSTPPVDSASGEISARALVSRTGHRLELVDDPGSTGITLATGDGNLTIRLDQTSQTLEVSSGGQVKVTGVGINLDAGSGTLELSGQSIKLSGQSAVEVSGAQIKLDGQSSTEVSASGSVTVRGGVVRIN